MPKKNDEGVLGCCGCVICSVIVITLGIIATIFLAHVLMFILYAIGAAALIGLVLGYFFPAFLLSMLLVFILIVCIAKIVQICCK